MDISDQQMKQLSGAPAAASHSFSPLNYMHSVDSFSSHFHNYNIPQPSLSIMNSSNINDISGLNKTPDSMASAHMNSPRIMFNPGNNMNMTSMSAGLDQIPGLFKTTYDYSFNQIYTDQAHMLNFAGVDPHDINIQTTAKSTDLHHDQKLGKVPVDPNPIAKIVLPSGCLGTASATHKASHDEAHRPVEYSTRKIVKPEPDMDQLVTPSSLMSSISGYPSGSNTGTSFFHGLGDMESFKEEAYFDQRRSTFDHIDAVASTSSSVLDHHHHHHFFDFSNLPSFSLKDMNPSMINPRQSTKNNATHGINEKNNSSNNKASCTHMGTETTISAQTRCKAQVAPKRRKSQQKRVVCVPATGGLDRPTGECLPSDSWAWRKYGQKPIKNSPYPRSYYKCSSVKGCTARKQVERNPSDPLVIIITYTVEHSHPTLTAAAEQSNPPKGTHEEEEEDDDDADKQSSQIDKRTVISADGADAISEESCEPISSEGTYHDINNEENMMIESAHDIDDHDFEGHLRAYQLDDTIDDQQGVSSMLEGGLLESKTSDGVSDNMGLLSPSSHYLGTLKKTVSSHDHKGKAEEDVFSQLDELPGLFGSNDNWSHDQEGINTSSSNHINIDPFDLYYWH